MHRFFTAVLPYSFGAAKNAKKHMAVLRNCLQVSHFLDFLMFVLRDLLVIAACQTEAFPKDTRKRSHLEGFSLIDHITESKSEGSPMAQDSL